MQHGPLLDAVAVALADRSAYLAQHWGERAVAATPRRAESAAPSATPPVVDGHAVRVIRAVAAALRTPGGPTPGGPTPGGPTPDAPTPGAGATSDPPAGEDARPVAEVMQLGWAAGCAACTAGLSVHHVVRDVDLLVAVLLADVEQALAGPTLARASAAEAFAVARRLHRVAGRYRQAAVSGFVHALLAEMRKRYRLLRHDLRNPLGTIRSALSLMEDETVPAETRHGPGIRAMVARNAGSLDRLIGRELDDAAAGALLSTLQSVALRDVALAARREVRAAAHLAGCTVVVDLPTTAAQVDAAALELTLTAVLLAALARAAAGTTVRITLEAPGRAEAGGTTPGAVGAGAGMVARVSVEPAHGAPVPGGWWDEHGVRLALVLARDHGARLTPVGAAAPPASDQEPADVLVHALAAAPTIRVHLPVAEPPASG